MNKEVNFALPLRLISLLQMQLLSTIIYWGHKSPPPPWCSSAIIGTLQFLLLLLSLNLWLKISFCTTYPLFMQCLCSRMYTPQYPPQPWLGVPQVHYRLFTLPLALLSMNWPLSWIGTLQSPSVPLGLDSCPVFHSVLCHDHLYSPCPPCTSHQSLLLSWWCNSFSPKYITLPYRLHFNSQLVNDSRTTLVRYHKSSPPALQFNF